jgi:hypothetical protein
MIFYNKINSTVKCNGFLTKYFSIENGIRQGCPISALHNISFSHIVKPYLIFSVSEIVPIPIGSISDFCLLIS